MFFDIEKFGGRTSIIEENRDVSYSALCSFSREIAEKMGGRSLCFIMASNTLASIAGYVGCINGKIVPVMVDSGLHHDLKVSMTDLYKPSFIWMPDSGETFSGYEEIWSKEGYVLLKASDDEPCELFPELALLITTSGSTGSPKLVRQSYRNLESNTRSIIEYLGITEKERAVTSLPMNYVYGLSVINTHLCAGAALVLTGLNCYSPKFWQLFNEKEATSFAGVPFMYEVINKLKVFKKKELPTLKTMTQAGGKITPELHKVFAEYAAETGRDFVVMYGASEATARMGYLPPEKSLEKNGSMGIEIPGGRFELVDDEGNVITETDVPGELVYYGDNVTLGYAECREDLSKGDENRGRLATGDVALRDADGYYYVVGRKKRFIKVVGKRVNLDEVERNLKNELQTSDVACTGKDDSLLVYLVDESLQEAASEYVFEKIGISRGLYKTLVIPEIPKNPSGKILYSELKTEV
ncbi:MAG: AMP-binding protein [Clostridiales bacterium]|nr:AMP-binding protein [Clostridiales bacterium]